MKHKIQSIVLGGLVMGFGLVLAPSALAKELPSADLQNQLTTQINQQSTTEVAEGMAKKSQAQPSPTPTPTLLIINTGNNTEVDSSDQQSDTTTVNNDNQAQTNQTVNASANTGNNKANYNISIGGDAGVVKTGDATVYSQLQTSANTNKSGVSNSCPTGQGDSQVVNSGNNLNLDDSSSTNCTTTITNGNGAVINQVVNGEANTGDNQAKGNISIGGNAGVITTGNARVGTMMVSRANSNVVLVGGSGGNGGPGNGANIYIINTGNNATINDRRNTNTTTTVNNSNSATINQHASLVANTGDNKSNGNINLNGDAGVIDSVNAVVTTNLEAKANHNQIGVAQTAATGNSGSTNITNTGNDLDVDDSETSNTTTTVNNSNQADVDQTVCIEANTGRNTASRNIAINGNAGVITTGNAVVTTSLETDVNKNQTAVVNGAEQAGSNDTTEITNTGNDVDIDTSNTTNTSTTVNNTNQAEVNQQVNATANTGNNTANGNIGNTSITTGNVTINTEVITNANNNYTFIIDSNITGLDLFKQFVAAFLGMSWEDLVAGYNPSTPSSGSDTSVVNTGNNVNILAENTHNRQVVVNNTNTASVNQSVNASANTGGNSCNANIGDCQITTGDATIWTKLIANLNNNFTFIGTVQLPTPTPEPTPTPTPQPEIPSTPSVLGESTERSVLPATGGASAGLLGLGLLLAGAGLLTRAKKAQV